MRGGFLHNTALLNPIEAYLRRRGAQTCREYPVQNSITRGAIDLVATWNDAVIAIEAELTPDRVVRDVHKAHAIEADLLVIVVPTRRVAAAVIRRLRLNCNHARKDLPVWVLPLGPALERLRRLFPLFSTLNPGIERNSLTGG